MHTVLLVAGDYGCDSTTRETVNAMKKKNPDLVLALGDLSEVKDPDCFFNMFKSLDEKGKLKIALGFHDMNDGDDSSSRFSQYLSHFDMADPFYSFDYKNIHFLVMYYRHWIVLFLMEKGSQQYDFVKSDLAQASNNNKIDWIIVCGYQPFYTSPTAHPAPVTLEMCIHHYSKNMVSILLLLHIIITINEPILYILLPKIGDNPVIKDKNVNNYNNPGAPIYVTVGTAGGDLYAFAGQAPFIASSIYTIRFSRHRCSKERNTTKSKVSGWTKVTLIKTTLLSTSLNFNSFYFILI